MKDKKVTAVNTFFYAAVILVFIGVLFRLQHYPYGVLLYSIGSTLGISMMIFEIVRLRKKTKNLEQQINRQN